MNRYDIVEVLADHPAFGIMPKRGGIRVEDILPTPRLISEGTRHPVEAYRSDETDRYPGGIWRMRDDSYDPPGLVYLRVVVEVVE
jgi:hypothetical protein